MYKVAVLGQGLFRLQRDGNLEVYRNGDWQRARRRSLVDLPKSIVDVLCQNSGVNRSQIRTDFE